MKIFYYMSVLTLIMGFLMIGLVAYWMLYPYKPVVFNDPEFPIINNIVKQGQMLIYTSNYCKYMNIPAQVTRTFANEILYVTPSTITNRPMGCNIIHISVLVPQELPIGTYQLQQTYVFQVNPIRQITITEKTEEFQVIQ